MSKLPLTSLIKIILESRSSKRFLLGTIGSFSFSIAVILCTIGLMDGFEITLKKALSNSNGDIKIVNPDGLFLSSDHNKEKLSKPFITDMTFVLQIESFAITEMGSKGVLVKGVDALEFSKVTGVQTQKIKSGVAIGTIFAERNDLKVGDYITFAFASGKAKDQGGASIHELQVEQIVQHGIYEKDLRFVYMNRKALQSIFNYRENTANLGLVKIKTFENINHALHQFKIENGDEFSFSPYWSEFEVLLDAVKVEKFSISLVLQLIVVVAILNVLAFIIYISEIKSQEFFMLRALGLSVKAYQKFWFFLLMGIWSISGLVALALVEIFSEIILKLPFLKIPGDVYVLSELGVILDGEDYFYVYGVSLIWILLLGFITMKRLKSKSVIAGLRQEFS